MSPRPADAPVGHAFLTTRWTQVLSARGESPEARVALGQLCEAYWMPVFRFIRRSNYVEDEARDLTQEFFAQLLAHGGLDRVDPGKGRFRSYLLGAVKHFLAGQQDRANAAKRGGGQAPVPLELKVETHTTTSLQITDPGTPVPDAFFDRQWALNLIDRALNALAAEFVSESKDRYFETLKPWLVGEVGPWSQSEAAQQLGLTEGAVKVAIHRLRKRFRALVKEEIAGTVDEPATVQEELRYLLEALAQN
ncbi:MAG: sigma-70 family RNA polymerase sigma factor [Verrucomicrobiota bacterium]